MRVLRARLYERELAEQQAKIASERKAQVGSGERSEKVRTYNFPQGRVTDHRIKHTSHNLDGVLGGELARVHRGARGGGEAAAARGRRRRRLTARDGSGQRREALGAASTRCARPASKSPRLDAELLLAEATGWDRAALAADPEAEVPPPAARRFGEMVRRRLRREPVAYILGRKGFRHIELAVDRAGADPAAGDRAAGRAGAGAARRPAVLDVGTGSGAIALAIADELPGCEVTATDTSPAALEVARANAERLGLAEPGSSFLEGDPARRGRSSTSSSPTSPTSPSATGPSLQPEVTEWEPREALLAGPDGLDAYRA